LFKKCGARWDYRSLAVGGCTSAEVRGPRNDPRPFFVDWIEVFNVSTKMTRPTKTASEL
jgi:hypothetical protein